MICQKVNSFRYGDDGTKYVEAEILASTAPTPMPTTGEGIERLNDSDVLEPGSIIYVVNSGVLYMMNEENEFKEQ